MKNNDTIYGIVVHTVNWILLGFIGFIAFFLVVNISPGPKPYGLIFGYIIVMLLIWGWNYWYQSYKKRKWIVLTVGTIFYFVIALFLLGVVVPFLSKIIYSYDNTGQYEDRIGEEYDGDVPIALLYIDNKIVGLTEANISWNTDYIGSQKTIEDIEQFASSLNETNISSGKKVFLDLIENEENGGGGDIWTDSKITVSLLNDNERIELELDESRELLFPKKTGNYVLEVEFVNSAGKAQYVGNVVIE
ncbi:hypothetical protein ACFQ4N_04090 [Oceanobacillus iheyensis]|uniref:Uncharacterized protein n=1 Tax=Oceanobacillus iheyensis (strain DSM 14371 / CIP 107618 / JCM 11309 / KCTC 3954 / HTE831) TaxID=221109 RepID=Q8ES74_OCEIH|nr:hypothetical protein [Oceanobacillus iheyensis]BAC12725.1 hypothetical protein [Oceanobacillus iheyensis HTE831]